MKYYSEEEIRNKFRRLGFTEDAINAYLNSLTPAILPTLESTSSDRERIRMELWCKLYSYPSTNEPRWDLQAAMNDFDKQFPK